jgi:formate/nitrite transporter
MDYVNPQELVSEVRQVAVRKCALSTGQMLIRGALAGGILAYATSLVFVINTQGLPPIVSALCFPAGFVILVLLGLELATGNFAILPVGWLAGEVRAGALLRNWLWVYIGNLIGSAAYAALFYLAITGFGTTDGGPLGEGVRKVAQAKTLGYIALGTNGWWTAVIKAVLCNWMVTLGAILALASRSTLGKIVAMWLPIATFFAHGYEHSIVNMFVLPAGIFFGAPITVSQWWLWNQIPVTIGNIVAGLFLTGLPLGLAYPAARKVAAVVERSGLGLAPKTMPREGAIEPLAVAE